MCTFYVIFLQLIILWVLEEIYIYIYIYLDQQFGGVNCVSSAGSSGILPPSFATKVDPIIQCYVQDTSCFTPLLSSLYPLRHVSIPLSIPLRVLLVPPDTSAGPIEIFIPTRLAPVYVSSKWNALCSWAATSESKKQSHISYATCTRKEVAERIGS